MILEIDYEKKATKFLEANSKDLSKEEVDFLILKAIKKLLLKENTNIDLKRLKGSLSHLYRIRKNDIRILFNYQNNQIIVKVIVKDIDRRGNIY